MAMAGGISEHMLTSWSSCMRFNVCGKTQCLLLYVFLESSLHVSSQMIILILFVLLSVGC